ncbi:MAG: CPBP family intramembrane metalloprotease [Gammaproteobacteria bacterium]|nr:CPBP family intramembrane metalloprotease [Gammaproteobacteria bacterium]NIR98868.1 CPBP family intramembrane metalloprotease [Gammaproteobacteria bacterium]NIT63989.1 CPBP family intramembrane metalloprotease [Gammaproteobacteria bacterium]NIV19149.1 CPBP family intramembrane metalloprotease [Gammaproteobacteria bacterium]NIX10318.1 CPBP family intramembrane metalloprotease [Gammaproteobacteria bacterium]
MTPGERWRQALEVAVFVVVIVPAVLLSFALVHPERVTFAAVATASMASQVILLGLVLLFVRRSGDGLAGLGWRGGQSGREALLGVALFVPFYLGAGALETFLRQMGLGGLTEIPPYLVPRGPAQYGLALLFVGVVAVAEESIFRGYLILRLRAVTGSTSAAVAVSTVVFALGHGYQGSVGVITVGAMGLVFALVYLWRGSLVAPAVMHFLQDFIGIVLLPLAGMA